MRVNIDILQGKGTPDSHIELSAKHCSNHGSITSFKLVIVLIQNGPHHFVYCGLGFQLMGFRKVVTTRGLWPYQWINTLMNL